MSATTAPDRPALLRADFTWLESGRAGDAEALGRDLLRHDDADIEALLPTGLALGLRGHAGRAAPLLDRVANARPNAAHPCRDLATVLPQLGRPEAIGLQYAAALAHAPADSKLRYAYADHLHEAGETRLAVEILAEALHRQPDFDVAHNLIGVALYDLGRLDDAIIHFRRATEIDRQVAVGWANLGMALKTQSRFDPALDAYDRAVALSPGDPQIRLNRAIALLRASRMAEAWPDYENRLRMQGQRATLDPARLLPDLATLPDLAGRIILLTYEEGFGDTLQFLRYAPLLAARGARVLAAVPGALTRLLAGAPGLSAIVPPCAPLPPHDHHCPFFSLPRAFGTDISTIPADIPYLHTDLALAAHWAAHLPPPERPRIGLVWAGQARPWLPGFTALDRRRSMALADLAPLAALPDLAFISRQKGPAAAEPAPPALALANPMHDVADFADTAAIIENLDLVLSVDTAVAHLAAALGKPVFLLDRYDSCWRWLAGREDSPWYPTLRIFRQQRMGIWEDVLPRIVQALRERFPSA
jgi:tetratricopeptide (TPR) repeat protein